MLRPEDEVDLHLYYSGALTARLGMRSSMGAQLELARLGAILETHGTVGVEMTEETMYAAWTIARIESVLHRLPKAYQRVLAQYYTPLTPGETAGMAQLGRYVRLAEAACPRAKLTKLCRRATSATADGMRARMAIAKIVADANASVQRARRAYGEGWACRRKSGAGERDERPWYTIW